MEFPKEIIQHIQSFLTPEEAAETSLVSKSWFKAWSTRSTLSFTFDYNKYDTENANSFWNFVKKTINTYTQLNLKLNKLALMIEFEKDNYVSDSPVDELIIDCLGLRVSDLHVDVINYPKYVLPAQVFQHVYLTQLVLFYCKVVVEGNVSCSNVVSLVLGHVSVESEVFERVLLGCRLVEQLKMFGSFEGLTRMNVGCLSRLETFFLESYGSITVEFEEKEEDKFVGGLVKGSRFGNLKLLLLKNAEITDCLLFSTKFQYKFPCLEDLTLENCSGYGDIQISSKTMKFLNVIRGETPGTIALDVPNIIVFRFNSECIPALSFAAVSKEWRSELSLSCHDSDGLSWFQKLRDFIVRLGCSNVVLNVTIRSEGFGAAPLRNIECPPVVEKLEVKCRRFSFFMGWLLWSCRPKLVTQTYHWDTKAVKVLYEKLVDQTADTNSPFIYDLKEVGVEIFDESCMEWLRTEASPDVWEILNDGGPELLRIRLTWGSLTPQEDTIINFVLSKPRMISRGSFMMVLPDF